MKPSSGASTTREKHIAPTEGTRAAESGSYELRGEARTLAILEAALELFLSRPRTFPELGAAQRMKGRCPVDAATRHTIGVPQRDPHTGTLPVPVAAG
jgi:hypothetical protein